MSKKRTQDICQAHFTGGDWDGQELRWEAPPVQEFRVPAWSESEYESRWNVYELLSYDGRVAEYKVR